MYNASITIFKSDTTGTTSRKVTTSVVAQLKYMGYTQENLMTAISNALTNYDADMGTAQIVIRKE